jgi:hypothetical protein
MKVVKTIRNYSRVEQFTVWGGQRYAIPPLGTATIKAEIAEQLARECHPLVKLIEEIDTYFDPEWTGPRVWLYNATGNEDAPEKVVVYRIVDKRKTPVEIDNPHREQKLVIHQYDRGQRHRTDGEEGFESMGTVPIEFYPYTRRSLPKNIADWVLSRDSMVTNPGEVKRAKPPGFEPDDTWDYESVCHYARLLGLNCKTETTIRNSVRKGEFGGITFEQAIDDEKLRLLHRIFFKCCHPHTPEITEEKYKSVLDSYKREDKKELTEKKTKKLTRPPPQKGKPEVEITYADPPEISSNTSAFVG